jgi:O-antigen/teichoic acid export membrane protein
MMSEKDHNRRISTKSRRIARNTIFLYFRQFLLLLIGLYTSRVVLYALGETNYGIYTEVGGFVALFSVLSGSLSAAISRFLTFELGKNEPERLSRIFSSAILIQLSIALIVIGMAEIVGPHYIARYLNIPADRLRAAHWIFQFSLLAFAINLISVPYNASIIAHERMDAFAYIGIFEGVCKLAIALLIVVSPIDRLVFYSASMCVVAILVRVMYGIYCRRHFAECRVKRVYDKEIIREMFSFAGWNFIGASSGVLRDHGGTLILGYFFDPAVNAARGLANQVNSTVNQFVTNFMTAMNPQITKSYATGDRDYMMGLIYRGSRYSLFLLYLIAFPILFNTQYLLELWQVHVPDHTAQFVRLALVFLMIEAVSYPLITVMLATGKIRDYQIVVGGLQCLNLPLAFLALRLGKGPEFVYFVAIGMAVVCFFARITMLRGMIGLRIKPFMGNVVLKILSVAAISVPLPLLLSCTLKSGFWNMILICLVTEAITLTAIWFIGLRKDERRFFLDELRKKFGRKRDILV